MRNSNWRSSFALMLTLSWLGCGDSAPNAPSAANDPSAVQTPHAPDASGPAQAAATPQSASQTTSDEAGSDSDMPVAAEQKPELAEAAAAVLETGSAKPQSTSEIIAAVDNGVVLITARDALGRDVGAGSGFVIDKQGLVATNYHVLAQAVSAVVQFQDGTAADIQGVRASDADHDLVILEIADPPSELESFDLQAPEKLPVGTELIAIGHPSGFQFTVTTGIVSAVRKTSEFPPEYQEFVAGDPEAVWVQTTAGISAGSSGGPLLNGEGDVVAINTWIAGGGQNLGFAIHVDHLIDLKANMATESARLPLPGLGLFMSPDVAMLIEDFNRELQHYQMEARGKESREEAMAYMIHENPRPAHGRKFLELAQQTDDADAGVEALYGLFRIVTDASPESTELLQEAIALARERYLDHERMTDVALVCLQALRKPLDLPLRNLLSDLQEKSPHKDVRGVAAFSLASMLPQTTQLPDVYTPDRRQLLQGIAEDYADVRIRGTKLGEQIEGDLTKLTTLSIGRKAPDIQGTDVNGDEFALSDYAGKVTMVDFAADWCPHCRKMYPKEREMVEAYADRPFALLGVSSDEKATLKRLVDAETVTWRNWHDGPQGPISDDWQVDAIPTIYVLDGDRRVRHVQNGGGGDDLLIAKVERLMAEQTFALPGAVLDSDAQWSCSADPQSKTEWRQPDFDDSGWATGTAPLGFGQGDEATRIEQRGRTTYYFRSSFTIEDPSTLNDAILRFFVDDGAAIFINNQEIHRTSLPSVADSETVAAMPAVNNGREPNYATIDVALFKQGKNTIVVEVHQEHPDSADLRFAATLHVNAMQYLKQQLAADDPGTQQLAISAVRSLGDSAAALVPELRKRFDEAESEMTRVPAAFALLEIDPKLADDIKLPDVDTEAQQTRDLMGYGVGLIAYEVVMSDQFATDDYRQILRHLQALPFIVSKEYAEAFQVYTALAAIRVGDYDVARKTLPEEEDALHSNPQWLACLSLIEHGEGHADKAQQALEQMHTALESPDWAWDPDTLRLAQEADTLVGQAEQ